MGDAGGAKDATRALLAGGKAFWDPQTGPQGKAEDTAGAGGLGVPAQGRAPAQEPALGVMELLVGQLWSDGVSGPEWLALAGGHGAGQWGRLGLPSQYLQTALGLDQEEALICAFPPVLESSSSLIRPEPGDV